MTAPTIPAANDAAAAYQPMTASNREATLRIRQVGNSLSTPGDLRRAPPQRSDSPPGDPLISAVYWFRSGGSVRGWAA
jgi:hypothetical protein